MLSELKGIKERGVNGLHLLQLPTGYGKTYNVVQFMAGEVDTMKKGERFIYITQLKKNLVVKDLESAFTNKEKHRKNVLVVKSIADQLVECLIENDKFVASVPEKFKKKEFWELQKVCERYSMSLEPANNDKDLAAERLEKLRECEKRFRRKMKKEVDSIGKSDTKKLKVLSDPKSEFYWLGKLYPTTFISDYKIIIMTVDKFLNGNISLIKNSNSYYDTKFLKNSTVIMDEFDATKNVIEKFIIEKSCNQSAELLSVFNNLRRYWRIEDFNEELVTAMRETDANYIMEGRKNSVSESLFTRSQHIEQTYSTNLSFKLKDIDVDKSYNFLFYDGEYITINENGKIIVCKVKKGKGEKQEGKYIQMEYTHDKIEESVAVKKLQSCIYEIDKYLVDVQWYIKKWAEKYMEISNENKLSDSLKMNLEEAINTICRKLQLDKAEKNILMGINQKTLMKTAKYGLRAPCFYEKGVTYFDLRDENDHADTTDINILKVEETPEKYLLHMAKTTNIIGISATAENTSRLCNYDLKYLRNQLKDDFYTTSKPLKERVCKEMEVQHRFYKDGKVKVHVEEVGAVLDEAWDINNYCMKLLEENGENLGNQNRRGLEEMVNAVSQVIQQKVVIEKGLKYDAEGSRRYLYERYCKFFAVAYFFIIKKDIQSMLYLSMMLPKEGRNSFDKNILNRIFEIITTYMGSDLTSKNIVVLDSQNYEVNKQVLINRLEKGEKIIVISTYSTLGAGQNLQYKVPDQITTVTLGDGSLKDSRYKYKDFDAIFLGEVTNIVTNILGEGDFSRRDAMNRVCQIERLCEGYEIDRITKKSEIRKTFMRVGEDKPAWLGSGKHTKFKEIESVNRSAERTMLQAVGRICRTFNKNSNVYIWIEDRLMRQLDKESLSEMIFIPELEKIIEVLEVRDNKSGESKKNKRKNEEIIAKHKSIEAERCITRALRSIDEEETIIFWEELREFVLRNPTLSDENLRDYNGLLDIESFYMTNGKEDNTGYCYLQSMDYKEVNVRFTTDKSKYKAELGENSKYSIHLADEEHTWLPLILKYPGMKEYFIKEGYSTTFEPNKYVMVPIIYNNIYKGALGEKAGKFIFEKETGVKLHNITDQNKFEKFDYKINEETYVDFKNWSGGNYVDGNVERKKIKTKMQQTGAKIVLVINLCSRFESMSMKVVEGDGIIEIPSLLNEDGCINYRSIDKIMNLLGENNAIYK